MKKIAILRCLKTSAACAGTGCLRAFNEKSEGFAAYGDEPLQLAAMWTCNGCGADALENQAGIQKKIDRMVKNSIEIVHLSHCTIKDEVRCPVIMSIASQLAAKGVIIADGTHGSEATGEIITEF